MIPAFFGTPSVMAMKARRLVLLAILSVGVMGCRLSGNTSPHRLLSKLGLQKEDAQFVTIEMGHRVYVIHDRRTIRRFYSAIDEADGPRAKWPLESLIGFIQKDGRAIVGGFSPAGDVSRLYGSRKMLDLMEWLLRHERLCSTQAIPPFTLRSASTLSAGSSSPIPRARLPELQKTAQGLIGLWNPDSLQGCIRADQDAFKGYPGPTIVLELSKPIEFKCFVRGQEEWWPPQDPKWAGAYKPLSCSRIAVTQSSHKQVQLAFYVPKEKRWYVTARFYPYNTDARFDTLRKQYYSMVTTATVL